MPVIYDTTPIIRIPEDTPLAKYLDLTKFLSLLVKESLFFCRLDRLEDQFEGTTAKKNYDFRINVEKTLRDNQFFTSPHTDEDIAKNVNNLYELGRKFKALYCVNCWNKFDKESTALWKIYSDYGKGILIKTSAKHLEGSLSNITEKIYLTQVKYIDYEKELMLDYKSMYPVIHKQDAYSYESEARLFYQADFDSFFIHDWEKEEVQEGKYFKVNLDTLIEEIIIGPFSPAWFLEIVSDLNERFGLNKPIKKSKLSK